MLKIKPNQKYDFFEFNSELEIPNESIINGEEKKDLSETNNLDLEQELSQYNNNLKIEHSIFIIKAPKKILLIFSIDKDLPVKIENNFFSIPLSNPVLQVISFMHDSKDESILISTGDSLNNIEVLQIELKKLMHEFIYNKLNYIKNSLKIIPIKNSLALILHYKDKQYKNDFSLKLWKNFNEEIYNFQKAYNFAYNFEYNKVICLDNKEPPFIISIYPFDESFFNRNKNEILQPEFFISLSDYIKKIKENDIETFLYFESFSNIICFWAKSKNILSGYLLSIIFVNFKEKNCFNCIEFKYNSNNKYFFKINKNSNEIYLFNLSQELLDIYSFKKQHEVSENDLCITKIHFTGNIKGIDFTENNGLVILTKQNSLICYSKNENIFKNFQKKYKEQSFDNDSIINNNLNIGERQKSNFDINNLSINQDNLSFYRTNFPNIKNYNLTLEKNDISIDFKTKNIHNNIKKILNIKNKKNNDKSIYFNKVDGFCQTDDNILNEKEKEFEDKKEKEEYIQNEKEKEKEITTLKNLQKEFKIFNERNDIKKNYLSVQFKKLFFIKLIKKFKESVKNLENNYTKNISISDLNIKTIDIESNNQNLKKKIEAIEKDINSLSKSEFEKYINFQKLKYLLFEEKSNIINRANIKNKIIKIQKNNKNIYVNENDNCDYESLELINKSLNMELKDKPTLKNKIEYILYKCNLIEQKINIICERNGNIKYNNDNLYIMLNYCKNDINIICEMYKYNKFNKQEESKFIYGLINPFINFYNKMMQDLESYIQILEKEIKMLNFENKEGKIHSFCENKFYKKLKDNKKKDNIKKIISEYLEEILEENNFYSDKGNIMTNYCKNLDDEFNN